MTSIDLLIIGSGPIGCTVAAVVHSLSPRAQILMVEAGPVLTERPGMHVRNLDDPIARSAAQRKSEGVIPSGWAAGNWRPATRSALNRPGTFSATAFRRRMSM